MFSLCSKGYCRYRQSALYSVSQSKDFVGVQLRIYLAALKISGHMLSRSFESAFNALALKIIIRLDLLIFLFGSFV